MRTCRGGLRRGGRLPRSGDVSILNYGMCADSGAAAPYFEGGTHGRLIVRRVGREDITPLGVQAGDGTFPAGGQVLLDPLDVVDHEGQARDHTPVMA